MNIVAFQREHLQAMRVQAAQADWNLYAEQMDAPFGMAWTAVDSGRVIACAGLVEMAPDTAYAWALIGEDAGPHMVAITRAIRSVIAQAPYRRVEMAVDAKFGAGLRWASMLGFTFTRDGALPNGHSAHYFVREA